MGRMQLWLSIGSAVWVVVRSAHARGSVAPRRAAPAPRMLTQGALPCEEAGRRQAALVILLIVGAAWSVDEYYVYDRQTGSYVVRLRGIRCSARAGAGPRLTLTRGRRRSGGHLYRRRSSR